MKVLIGINDFNETCRLPTYRHNDSGEDLPVVPVDYPG